MNTERKRGRPVGSEISSDRATLEAIADVMIQEPKLTPTAAIRRVLGNSWTDSAVRRLRDKWKQRSAVLLTNAKRRQETRMAGPTTTSSGPGVIGSEMISRGLRAALSASESASDRMVREVLESPSYRLARRMEDDPAIKLMRQMENDPVMRIAREYERLRRLGF